MKRVFKNIVVLIALFAGCGDDVVDIDDLTNGESPVGMWTTQ